MFDVGIVPLLGLGLVCIATAFLALFVVSILDKSTRKYNPVQSQNDETSAIFLFEEDMLLDANLLALDIISNHSINQFDWGKLTTILGTEFPTFPTSSVGIDTATIAHKDGQNTANIQIETVGRNTRVTVQDWIAQRSLSPMQATQTQEAELTHQALIEAATSMPYPSWKTDHDNRLTWANTAYEALAREIQLKSDPDTIPEIFPKPKTGDDATRSFRKSLKTPMAETLLWYDVINIPTETGFISYAIDANALVNAEFAQRNFVQTLTKTFAQLSIGLAIFDRNRQLALFNPALIDLTSLPADFLSARPNLLSFFDRMRENRMMPEPKSYSNWREQISELMAAAADGRYSETWTLPSGLTYRVTGRPHPDGAVAFLFEDISAEISLTRRFRSELELGQSVLDTLQDAVAVFSSTGVLTFSNKAYHDLWGVNPETSFIELTVRDASRQWQESCQPNTAWGKMRDFVVDFGDRYPWTTEVTMLNGRTLTCAITPINGGATLIAFSSETTSETARALPQLTH